MAKKIEYLHKVLLRNNCPDWIIKILEKKPTTPTVNLNTGLEVSKNIFISAHMFLASVKYSKEFFDIPVYSSSSKDPTPLNPFSCIPKIKSHCTLNKTLFTNSHGQRKIVTISYIGKSSRWLQNRVKEHSSHVTSIAYQHSVSNNHPKPSISHLKILYQDSKPVAREAIQIRIKNPALNCNMGKNVCAGNLKQPSWSRWIFQWVQPYGRLRPPMKAHTPYHSK